MPVKGAKSGANARPADAALGRATRGLIGRGSGRAAGAPDQRSGRATRSGLLAGRLSGVGRIVTPARAAGLLGMLASGFMLTFVTGPSVFGLSRTDIPELTWTDSAAIVTTLDMPASGNVFQLDTAPLEAALGTLPAVAAADVSVSLPDAAVVIHVVERRPVLAWQVRNRSWIADGNGVVFAVIEAGAALPAGVTVVDDRRQGSISLLSIGGRLDAVDLDVATRLGSLTPADVGSVAAELAVSVTDDDGYIVTMPAGWTAVFGFYSPATRPADMVPGQVRLLRSLLAGREATVRRILLASETDGTYVLRTTPKPTRQ